MGETTGKAATGTRLERRDEALATVAEIAVSPGGVRLLLARRRELLDRGEGEGAKAIRDELRQALPRWRRWLLPLVGAMG